MIDNNNIALKRFEEIVLTQEEAQIEVDDLYHELEKRFGSGFADQLIKRYTTIQPRRRADQ